MSNPDTPPVAQRTTAATATDTDMLLQPGAFQKTLATAFFAPIVAMVALALLLALQIRNLLDAGDMVEHTDQIIAQANLVRQLMVDEETGQRGYLVGGSEQFLEPYSKGLEQLPAALTQLESAVSDRPEQAQRVRGIRDKHSAWLAEAQREMDRVNDPADKRTYFNEAHGKTIMDDLRREVNEFVREETVFRTERDSAVRNVAQTALLSTLGASVLLGGGLATLTRSRLRQLNETYRHAMAEEQQARHQIEQGQLLLVAKTREVEQLNAELEQRVQQRTAQLEVTNKELEAFAYSVSHDLRAPLRSLDGFSSALLEDYGDSLDSMGKTYLTRLRANSKQMGELIDGLLTLSRLTRADMRVEPVNLSALAHETAESLQRTNPEREIQWDIADGVTVQGDSRLLRNVLENLMGNAFKFTAKREGAKIAFGVAEKDGKPVYFVRDNGAGFDMAYVGKLFGAFQRLHGAKEFEGTGIGLATVQRIIRRHGGQIWAEGEVGQGATFFFTLA